MFNLFYPLTCFPLSGRTGLLDLQQIAKENNIEIMDVYRVEIPADPTDLDAAAQLKKIKDSGLIGTELAFE